MGLKKKKLSVGSLLLFFVYAEAQNQDCSV